MPQVDSEVGRLRTVLLHRPGPELNRLTPRNNDQLLFDGLPWVGRAQEEHDAFAEVLRGRGVEVLLLADLLREALADPAARRAGVDAAVDELRLGVDLADGLQLRRSRVMHADRIELLGFTEAMRERLKADGLFGEIISWKLRLFVPTGAEGPAVLGRLFARWPVASVAERRA